MIRKTTVTSFRTTVPRLNGSTDAVVAAEGATVLRQRGFSWSPEAGCFVHPDGLKASVTKDVVSDFVHVWREEEIGTHPCDTLKPGDGATFTLWSDSKAGTVVKRTANSIWWRRDNATLLNGPDSGEPDALRVHPGGFAAHVEGVQRWRYLTDPTAPVRRFTRRVRKNGEVVWKAVGSDTRSPGSTLSAGRHEHYDYNF